MPKIEWTESLSLGLERIDNQHKKLLEIANAFLKSIHERSDEAVIRATLRDLREYTVYHFHDEESYMKELQYPGLLEHRRQHEDLKRQVIDLQQTIYRQKGIDIGEIRTLLKEWLIDHILSEDMKLSDHLESKEE